MTTAPSPPSAPGRVLIIDDDVGVARALSRALRDHDVVTVASGREALDLLATDAGFDVVFCDLMMPDISGPEVYEQLEKTRPDLCARMVFMSGGAYSERTEEFASTTKCPLVSKPFDTKAVRALVTERVAARAR